MADERDPKVSQRYREMGSEEPTSELDQNIVAAARNAAGKPHAPLVTPAGRHRWYFSIAAAAVLVLAVAVTVHLDLQQPDPESVVGTPAPQVQKVDPPAKPAPPPVIAPDPTPRVQEAPRGLARERAPAPADSAGAPAGPEMHPQRAPAAEARAEIEPPERWLERIVQLRKEGRHEDADKALAEFRRRYPDYRVPESADRK